jgi:hypothetical protein
VFNISPLDFLMFVFKRAGFTGWGARTASSRQNQIFRRALSGIPTPIGYVMREATIAILGRADIAPPHFRIITARALMVTTGLHNSAAPPFRIPLPGTHQIKLLITLWVFATVSGFSRTFQFLWHLLTITFNAVSKSPTAVVLKCGVDVSTS